MSGTWCWTHIRTGLVKLIVSADIFIDPWSWYGVLSSHYLRRIIFQILQAEWNPYFLQSSIWNAAVQSFLGQLLHLHSVKPENFFFLRNLHYLCCTLNSILPYIFSGQLKWPTSVIYQSCSPQFFLIIWPRPR